VMYEFDEAGHRNAVVVRGRWTRQRGLQQVVERLPYTRDALDPLLDAGEMVLIDDVNQDTRASEELRDIQAQDGRPALAMIPLMVRGQRIGLVILSAARVHRWQGEELRPYQATASQLALALDSRRGQELLFQRGQELAVLQERQRLARELHDSVTQHIFSAMLIAQTLEAAYRRDPAEGQQRVEQLLGLCQSTLGEMRALLVELRPAEEELETPERPPQAAVERLRRYGLPGALHLLAADFERDGLAVELAAQLDGATAGLPMGEAAEAIYRITQEALNNIVKHAHATVVKIDLAVGQEGSRQWAHLVVSDDGQGFDPLRGAAQKMGGFGLVSMRERAELLGGSLDVHSIPGQGTRVRAWLPLDQGRG
jgi:signal transduction histidine kinase